MVSVVFKSKNKFFYLKRVFYELNSADFGQKIIFEVIVLRDNNKLKLELHKIGHPQADCPNPEFVMKFHLEGQKKKPKDIKIIIPQFSSDEAGIIFSPLPQPVKTRA